MSLSDKARAFALLNMAISDGLTSVFETKYFYVFWRPVTAIRAGESYSLNKGRGSKNLQSMAEPVATVSRTLRYWTDG